MKTYLAVLALDILGVALINVGIWLCVGAWFAEMPFYASLTIIGYVLLALVSGILVLREAYKIMRRR